MPTNRTPTRILEARGSFDRHPERRRGREPRPKGPIGSAPEHLSESQRDTWDYLVEVTPEGVLMASDAPAPALEVLAVLFDAFRKEQTKFTSRNYGTLLSLFGRFGYTPANRAALEVEPPPERDPFAAFDA